MISLRRRLGVLLLPLVLALGPGLTLCVHACQVRGTEVSLEANAHCCKGHGSDSTEGLVFETSACCSESDAQIQLTAPVQRTEGLVLYPPTLSVEPFVPVGISELLEVQVCDDPGRGPPRYLGGRSRLISYSIARV